MSTPLEPMNVGFIFKPDLSEVLLLRKTHPDWQKGLLNGVGGHVNEEELANAKWVESWCREVKEETGIVLIEDKVVRIGRITVISRGITVPTYAYRMLGDEEPKQMTDEAIEWHDPYRLVDQKCIENLIFFVAFAKYKLSHIDDISESSRIELHYDYNKKNTTS